MSKFADATIGVTGANGHLGRAVIRHLREGGARRIVGLTRDPAKARAHIPAEVELRAADFADAGSLPAAFAGVDRLLIISTDTLAGREKIQGGAVAAAVEAGVSHLAYTSITSPYPDTNPAAMIPDTHYWTEAAIAASGANFALLRNNLYTDFLLPTAQNAVASGTLYHAVTGNAGRAYVTREDCARAAAGALLKAEGKRVYDISGPASVSPADLAALLAGLSGKPVQAVGIPGPALIAGLTQAGVPAEFAAILANFDADAGKGRLGVVTGDVAELSGQAPMSVADFLTAHKGAILG